MIGTNKYQLSRRFHGERGAIEISRLQFDLLRNSKHQIIRALSLEEAFDILIQNYMEFEKEVLGLTVDYMVRHPDKYGFHQDGRRILNRRLMNILTTARAYLDQLPSSFNAVIGSDSSYDLKLKSRVHSQYDSLLGYRVMEALRNYAQHNGFPIHGMGFGMQWVKDGDDKVGRIEFGTSPSINCEVLREDGQFKKQILREIEALGDKVDVRPLLREYLQGFGEIQDEYRRLTLDCISAAESAIEQMLDDFRPRNPSETQMGVTAIEFNNEDKILDREYFFWISSSIVVNSPRRMVG